MPVIVCPTCSARYRVNESQLSKASKGLKCQKCNTLFQLEGNIETEAPSQERGPADISPPPENGGEIFSPIAPTEESVLQDTDVSTPKKNLALDLNLGDIALDFGASEKAPSSEEETAEEGEYESQEEQGGIEIGLGDLSLEVSGGDDTLTRTLDQSLDFSFTASIPEVEEEEEGEEQAFQEEGEEPGEGLGEQGLPLGMELDFGGISGEQTVTLPGSPATLEPSLDIESDAQAEVVEERLEGEAQEEEPLSTCCIDSLAMGLTRCEICGRNLEGKAREYGQELEQQRRQQLKEELLQGEVQVGFAEEAFKDEMVIGQTEGEDFTDVERALDALADGTFEKTLKKKEAKKTFVRKMKMIGLIAGLIVVLIAGVILSRLPSGHDKLVSRYKKLVSQEEIAPHALVSLFLDAASEKDRDILNRISVQQTLPDISDIAGGTVISIGNDEDDEEVVLGQLGKDLKLLEAEINEMETEIDKKTKELQQETAENLSPTLIQNTIDSLVNKQEALQAEFDAKVAESAKKMVSLQQEIKTARQKLEESIQRAQKYRDATDEQGKAVYLANMRNQEALSQKIAKLTPQLTQEEGEHNERVQQLEIEYEPRFSEFEERLRTQRALYKKALSLQNPETSPITILSRELERLTQTIIEKKRLFEEKTIQLETAVKFFKEPNQRTDQDTAEFRYTRKNVIASINVRGGSKQQVVIVLTRYQAIFEDQTIQGDWVVETILR